MPSTAFPRCLLALAVLVLAAARAPAQSKVPIAWGEQEFALGSLPERLPGAAKKAIAEWEPWAAERGYRIDLDAQGRILLLTPAKGSQAASQLALIERAEKWFDRLLPAPDRRPIAIAVEKKTAPSGKDAPAAPAAG